MLKDSDISRYSTPRTHRTYTPEFKAELVAACQQPGVSIAALAGQHGMNANVLHRWVKGKRAVKQVTERGHGVVDVAKRLGMSDKSLYLWVRLAKEQLGVGTGENATLKAEVSRLKAELKRAN